MRSSFILCGFTDNIDPPLLNYVPELGGSWFRSVRGNGHTESSTGEAAAGFHMVYTNVKLSGAEMG